MNLQKLTLKSQQALQTAQEIAGGYSNQQIEPIHIRAAMLQDAAGIVPPMLMKIGANLNYLKIGRKAVGGFGNRQISFDRARSSGCQ